MRKLRLKTVTQLRSTFSIAHVLVGLFALACSTHPANAEVSSERAKSLLVKLQQAKPTAAAECTTQRLETVRNVVVEVTEFVAAQSETISDSPLEDVRPMVQQILDIDARVELLVLETLALRTQFKDSPEGDPAREQIRNYLSICEQWITLDGRMNYLQRDLLDTATYRLASRVDDLRSLVDALTKIKSVPGAATMSFVLEDPDPATQLQPYPNDLKLATIQLMAASRTMDVVSVLGRYVRQPNLSPELSLAAMEALRHVGIPQAAHPQQDPSVRPPSVTPAQLLAAAEKIQPGNDEKLSQRKQSIVSWLSERTKKGIVGNTFRVGRVEVQPGDWFLMRNPSPFNLFTDIAPGLFTHVGIVTTMTDAQGIRRFVVTDIPERGDHVPATNVDAYVHSPLHYVFLRHDQPQVNAAIAKAAAETIGNPSQFDLLFRTNRVASLKGKSLKGELVHTYCAGYLLLCAQQSGLPRSEFFPIQEFPPSKQCITNMSTLGLRLGENYISPTGPLFSTHHQILGGRKPFYNPAREIQSAAFDHFGAQMTNAVLKPSPNLFQSLRSKMAGLSRYNPWLARALAKANNVSPRIDLEAAAAAAAVIETLDEIAIGASEDFEFAKLVLANTNADLINLPADDFRRIPEFRKRHAELDKKVEAGQITPRELRIALVNYYKAQARQALDARFFPERP